MQKTMKAVRQHEAGGELIVETIPLPEPGPGQVLIKMAASPINPSDLAGISKQYMVSAWPFTPGMEGSGTVVGTGKGILPALRKGKRVACTPDPGGNGTWAEYMVSSAARTVPLPREVSLHQGSMMLVNPMTALAFIQIARKGDHPAMVNNAAASALGRMLVRLAARHQIPLINIVRRQEQADALKEEGAVHVLVSTAADFDATFRELCKQLGATLALDAVTGKETGRLLGNMPDGSTLVAYARLSGDPIEVDPADLIRYKKQITGFQLANWLQSKPLPAKLRLTGQLRKLMPQFLRTEIHQTYPLDQVNEAIRRYQANMSKGKILLVHA
jgi:NADPH:quinone reductase-like Zn-dependent oxidoreductase